MVQAYLESPGFDADDFMTRLVFTPGDSGQADALPSGPIDSDDVVVRRTFTLPYPVDANLRAAAAAAGCTVEELLGRWWEGRPH